MKYSTLQAVYLPKTEAEKEALEQVANHAQHYPACVHCACLKNCLSDCALIREDYEETLHPPVDYEAEEEADYGMDEDEEYLD